MNIINRKNRYYLSVDKEYIECCKTAIDNSFRHYLNINLADNFLDFYSKMFFYNNLEEIELKNIKYNEMSDVSYLLIYIFEKYLSNLFDNNLIEYNLSDIEQPDTKKNIR